MNQDCIFHSLKLILGFLALVVLAWLLGGCGSLVHVEYRNLKYGGSAVAITLPKNEGHAK